MGHPQKNVQHSLLPILPFLDTPRTGCPSAAPKNFHAEDLFMLCCQGQGRSVQIALFLVVALSCAVAVRSFAAQPSATPRFQLSSTSLARFLSSRGAIFALRGAGEDSGAPSLRTQQAMEGPINTIAGTDALEWDDRKGLQDKWTNAEKGWKVAVEWKQTPYGVGVFAAEDIPAGTVLRVGKHGLNQQRFGGAEDVESFCKAGATGSDGDEAAYRSRVGYAKDYLFGFFPDTDERGYPPKEGTVPECVAIWIPGNGLNHNPAPNTVYRPAAGGVEEGINLEALGDVKSGEELLDDYRRHGKAPGWAIAWAQQHGVSLNFAECNDFVLAKPEEGC